MNIKERWTNFKEFLGEVKKESSKVAWPGKDEVIGTTTVVVVTTVIVGVYLAAIDAMITPLMNKLYAAFGG